MRREKRQRFRERDNFKTLMLLSGGVLALAVLTFVITFTIYNKKIVSNVGTQLTKTEQMASLDINNYSNNIVSTQEASSEIGKSIEDVKNDVVNNSNNSTTNNDSNNTTQKNNTVKNETVKTNINDSKNKTTTEENKKQEQVKDPTFIKPVEGEIVTKYAEDSLVFSETLQEWVTHLGVDIKANKATVVKAAADGKVESIKNDPRYGLTIIIVHDNGFKTVYSNLLTTEFVAEGEEVKSGQSIGTVGNTAAFEILDEPHLHFELIKNGEKIDPTGYIK